jgi:HSP90 family molecular chaperone
LIERFKTQLAERVTNVRTTSRLVESPARLVDPEGTLNPEMQRVYKMLNREFEMPLKVLEINPNHAILKRMSSLPADDPLNELVIEQVYEDALLIEGLHPDPASMINRIQRLLEAALKSNANHLSLLPASRPVQSFGMQFCTCLSLRREK